MNIKDAVEYILLLYTLIFYSYCQRIWSGWSYFCNGEREGENERERGEGRDKRRRGRDLQLFGKPHA